MINKANVTLFIVGALLMGLAGLFPEGFRAASLGVLSSGFIFLAAAVVKSGSREPRTALCLIVVSNLSFWMCMGMWHLRLKSSTTAPSKDWGIDIFAGALSAWLLILLMFSIYEVVIFAWSAFANRQRSLSVIGIIAVLLQVSTSLRVAYRILQGV